MPKLFLFGIKVSQLPLRRNGLVGIVRISKSVGLLLSIVLVYLVIFCCLALSRSPLWALRTEIQELSASSPTPLAQSVTHSETHYCGELLIRITILSSRPERTRISGCAAPTNGHVCGFL
jgi:hypothetical protein